MATDADLLPGETELLHLNRHWIVLARRVAAPLLVGIVVLVIGAVVGPLNQGLSNLRWLLLLVLLISLLVWVDIRYIIWRSETVTLTDQRVLMRRGVFGKYSRSIGIQRVQDVTTSQGMLGRMLDYGTVEVESAGKDGAEILDHLPAPGAFRNLLFEHIRASGGSQPNP